MGKNKCDHPEEKSFEENLSDLKEFLEETLGEEFDLHIVRQEKKEKKNKWG